MQPGGIASEDDQTAGFELDQTLSILLPQDLSHQETADRGFAAADKVLQASVASHPKESDTNTEFRNVLVEDYVRE